MRVFGSFVCCSREYQALWDLQGREALRDPQAKRDLKEYQVLRVPMEVQVKLGHRGHLGLPGLLESQGSLEP